MAKARQRGSLGTLEEIPWGTPDADELLRLLGPASSRRDLDRAAALGTLQQLLDDAVHDPTNPNTAELAELIARPQRVRNVFREAPDWSCHAVSNVHRALVEAFGEEVSDIARLAGVHLADVDLDMPADDLWREILDQAAAQHRSEALLDVALADAAIGDNAGMLEAACERPWRIDEAPSVEPAPRTTRPRKAPRTLPARRPASAVGLWLGLAAAVFGAAFVSLLALPRLFDRSVPVELSIVGALSMPGARGRLVLYRAGIEVQQLPAEQTFAFDAHPLDDDDDGLVDPQWSIALERTDLPCPARPMPLRREAPSSQHWSVATARADGVPGSCRVQIEGLSDLTAGSIVAFDTDLVSPRRFAIVERFDGDRAEALALGPWESCHACWPSLSTCTDALFVLRDKREALLALRGADCTPEEDAALLAALPALPEGSAAPTSQQPRSSKARKPLLRFPKRDR